MRVLRFLSLGLVGLGLWSVGAGVAAAQTALYGEFSAAKVSSGNPWLFGPTVGLYHDNVYGFIATGLDVRGTFLHRDTTNLDSILLGGRLAFAPRVLPIKPYVEALGGLGHYGSSGGTSTKFEYQFLGGIDETLVPRLDWRVIEFSYGGLSVLNGSYNPKTLSTGIVFRLP